MPALTSSRSPLHPLRQFTVLSSMERQSKEDFTGLQQGVCAEVRADRRHGCGDADSLWCRPPRRTFRRPRRRRGQAACPLTRKKESTSAVASTAVLLDGVLARAARLEAPPCGCRSFEWRSDGGRPRLRFGFRDPGCIAISESEAPARVSARWCARKNGHARKPQRCMKLHRGFSEGNLVQWLARTAPGWLGLIRVALLALDGTVCSG